MAENLEDLLCQHGHVDVSLLETVNSRDLISKVGVNSSVSSSHSDDKVKAVISSGKIKVLETSVDVFAVI